MSDAMETEPTTTRYWLSQELRGHTGDVRSACFLEDGTIVTASRDRTAKVWSLDRTTQKYGHSLDLIGHEHFVGTVMPLPKHSSQMQGASGLGVATGGNDKIINCWDLDAPAAPLMTLIGHENVVCSLAFTSDGNLVSGSWDKTARIWRGTECILVLKGHTESVWCLLTLPNGDIITGSADKTIRVWAPNGVSKHTLRGHTDAVRGLADVPGLGFLSCGNDGLIFLWSYGGGEPLREYHGHTSFVYSVAALPVGSIASFVSGGEDRLLKIWRADGECVQTIVHPATIWAVAVNPVNGDIVAACSDGVARVFTRDQARRADDTTLHAFEELSSHAAIPKSALGDLNVDTLPTREAALSTPGTRDGETRVVRTGQVGAEVYQWSAADTKWVKLGDVVDAVGTASKTTLNGRQYDYVFDIDTGDGVPRQLGYNASDNPWQVAQEFIWREQLQQGFLDQIAQFIIANSQPVTIGSSAAVADVDPYTGASRYVPGSARPSGADQLPSDPFTGASRYRPQTTTAPTPATTTTTTATATVATMPATPTAGSEPMHFPQQAMVVFDTANFEAMLKKIKELSAKLAAHPATASVALRTTDEEDEVKILEGIVRTLQATSRYHATSFTRAECRLLIGKLLRQWPADVLFPIVDLVRLFVLHPSAAQYLGSAEGIAAVGDIAATLLAVGLSQTATEASQMLAARAVANMFRHSPTRGLVVKRAEDIIDRLSAVAAKSTNKNVRLAAATAILNFAVYLVDTPPPNASDIKMQCLSLLSELLQGEQDPETLFRTLVAVGTLIYNDSHAKSLVQDLELTPVIEAQTRNATEKVRNCAIALLARLR